MGHLMQYEEKIWRNEITAVSYAAVCLKDSNYIDFLYISSCFKQTDPLNLRHVGLFGHCEKNPNRKKPQQLIGMFACSYSVCVFQGSA